MRLSNQTERRDPASFVLRLSHLLVRADRKTLSGAIEVRDDETSYTVTISNGAVSGLLVDGNLVGGTHSPMMFVKETVLKLFALARPLVYWRPAPGLGGSNCGVRSRAIAVNGVLQRRDLFAPSQLIERLPVEVLHIQSPKMNLVKRLPLTADEMAFLNKLTVPTPVPMILWKRGLEPSHAGALLIALNLLGVFGACWVPGDLPRIGAVAKMRRKLDNGCSDHEILGVDSDATSREIDIAFRKMSFDLHPDRLVAYPERDAVEAGQVFSEASAAYCRLKTSRRKRPVRMSVAPGQRDPIRESRELDHLMTLVRDTLRKGAPKMARVFAIKALALSPGADIKKELLQIIRAA